MVSAGKYFPGDEPALATRLDAYLAGLATRLAAAAFAGEVRALVLAGGYGRGEGGVFRSDEDGAQFYNDLEFYVLMRAEADYTAAQAWCAHEAHDGDTVLGIEVEFKLLAADSLHNAPTSMFYYDLVASHHLVWGDADYISNLPARLRDPSLIPPHEATRLLFNRGSGLFYSRCALAKNDDERVDNGFIERNHAKVRLALADAVLALNGRYHWSCRERDLRLQETLDAIPPDWAELVAWHQAGVQFKLFPAHRHPSREVISAEQRKLAEVWLRTFLWLEGQHLGQAFAGSRAYAGAPVRLYPAMPVWRNLVLHLRDRIKRGGALPDWKDYPRAVLQRALCLMVDEQSKDADLARAARLIGAGDVTWSSLESAYLRWWRCYN